MIVYRGQTNRLGFGLLTAALVAAAIVTAPSAARAQWNGHDFGMGLRFGDPTGITGKVWLDGHSAVQFDVGWVARYNRFGYYSSAPALSFDWVYQFARFGPKSHKVWFGTHIGAGGSFGFVSDNCFWDSFGNKICKNALTARMPIAFNVYLAKPRFEFFVEIVPGLRLTPFLRPTLSGSLGARYYF